MALVPKWAGTDKAIPLHEFFETIESTGRIANWTQEDMVRIATLKLTDVARAFYNGTLELHDQRITWAAYKTVFQNRFRDVHTDQFHFAQLHMARQKKDESLQEFADRCRSLVHKTVPQVDDTVLQKLHYEHAERMLLASFTSGLVGTPGRQVHFSLPKNMQEALRITVTVHQAELQERRNETFYVDEVQERGKADRSSRGTRRSGSMRHMTQQAGADRTQDQSCKGSFRNSGRVNNRKCYECGGVGHFARECPSHQNRRDTRNHTSTRGSNAPQVSATTPSQEATRQPKG